MLLTFHTRFVMGGSWLGIDLRPTYDRFGHKHREIFIATAYDYSRELGQRGDYPLPFRTGGLQLTEHTTLCVSGPYLPLCCR